jgi:hypothetical protein
MSAFIFSKVIKFNSHRVDLHFRFHLFVAQVLAEKRGLPNEAVDLFVAQVLAERRGLPNEAVGTHLHFL